MPPTLRSFEGQTTETIIRAIGASVCEIRTVEPDPWGRSLLLHPDHVLLAMLDGGNPSVTVKVDGAEAYRGPKLTGAAAFFPAGRKVESVWPEARLRYLLMTTPHAVLEELVARPLDRDDWLPQPDLPDPFARAALQELGRVLSRPASPLDDLLADSIVTALHLRMLACPSRTEIVEAGASLPRRILNFIESHLDGRITLADLAREAGLPRAQLIRAFRAATGSSPYAYVTARRVERAKLLLTTTDLPIAEVSRLVGCSSQSHLTAMLTREARMTPRAIRLSRDRS